MTNRRNSAAPLWIMTWLVAFSAFAMLELGGSAWAQDKSEKASAPGAVTAESVLKKTSDFYKNAKSFLVDVNRTQKLGQMKMQHTTAVAYQRPNQ
jgi:outer membrane lipoprotein-sorting protein